MLHTTTTPGPMEITFDPGFGVFLGEAAEGEGYDFPQSHGRGLLTGAYFRGSLTPGH